VKPCQNTLFVTTDGTYLAREGNAILVRIEQQTKLRVPIHTINSIVCFGRVSCSPAAMQLATSQGVAIVFLNIHGRFIARLHGPTTGNVLLRREQYRRAEQPDACAAIARAIIAAKIANCRTALQRTLRDHPGHHDNDEIQRAVHQLRRLITQLKQQQPLDIIRGIEGDAARTYFGVFDHLIIDQKEHFSFSGRNRRPPTDNVNALLSFLYTLLVHDVASALETVGLDPAVGFLHRPRPGRPSLALDLMEELRPFLADRLALSLINRRQVSHKGLRTTESGAVVMDDATRRIVLIAGQKRKQEPIRHPFLDERIPIGLLPHMQAILLARHLRGDLDGYPPFIWK